MSEAPCETLAWDSTFFGLSIARAHSAPADAASCRAMLEWCDAHGIDCLYLLASGNAGTARLLEASGFSPVDERVTLVIDRRGPAAEDPCGTRPARLDDIPALRAIAAVSHHDSRFYRDSRFDRDRCDELYRTWIEQSVRGWAEHVLVAEREGRPAGYLTVHLRDGGALIGLVAVAPEFRRRGVGMALLTGAFAWTDSHDIARLSVVTQGANAASMALYHRAGFAVASRQMWYHRWFDRPNAIAR
jgi:dTDP-4-amino-4,6-dideoxy-D-galactose acyltransferase